MFFKTAENNMLQPNLTAPVAARFPLDECRNARLRALCCRFVTQTLVFRCLQLVADPTAPPDFRLVVAGPKEIEFFFGKDGNRARAFRRFLAGGNFGMVLANENEWVAYGWATLPGRGCAPHLPSWVRSLNAYWIFHCHTKEKFRGRGIYKYLLGELVSFAHRLGPGDVYIDALPENTASRRAIVASGFVPSGVTETFKLWLPRIGSLILRGSWSRQQPHTGDAQPALSGTQPGFPVQR